MTEKILKAITQNDLFGDTKEVTVALSGGADSMSLLYALLTIKDELKIKVYAAHFNHKIRGAEAERDEDFVRKYCDRLGVELFCDSADVPLFAKKNHLSIELAARELRYKFLSEVARGVVATAHNADDNLETVLFNLTRGTAIKGLCGIPIKRDIYVRPLLYCTREDIEKYCNDNQIEYVTDSTNLCDDYSRNRIRHNVTPSLKEINPSVQNAFLRTTANLTQDCDYIDGVANEEFLHRFNNQDLDLADFEKLHIAIAKRVIMRYYSYKLNDTADNLHIDSIYNICLLGGRTSLKSNMSAVVSKNTLSIVDNNSFKDSDFGYKLEIIESDNDLIKDGKKINGLLLNNAIDCDKIVGKLVERNRQAGDIIRLNRRGCTKTLKKLFTEYEIPLNLRNSLPLLADDEGLVWVSGIGVAQRCAVTEHSSRIIKIKTLIV